MNPDATQRRGKAALSVYLVMLVSFALQLCVAYSRLSVRQRASEMFTLTALQAALVFLFSMRLLQERRVFLIALTLSCVPLLIVMNAIWTDSFRILRLAPWHN